MKRAWLVLMAVVLIFGCSEAKAQEAVPLTNLRPVTEGLVPQKAPFSIAGKVMHFGLGTPLGDTSSVYDLGGKYSRFEAWVGILDNSMKNNGKRFAIRLDGKVVLDNKDQLQQSNDAPVHIDLDVRGAQSMKIVAEDLIYIGEPTLYKESATPSAIATLVAPRDGMRLTSKLVSLLWEPVDGATSYGVEIVCTKGSAPRIYALNAPESTAKFDLTNVASGEYHWSVVAFNGKGVMGKFSNGRAFTVAR